MSENEHEQYLKYVESLGEQAWPDLHHKNWPFQPFVSKDTFKAYRWGMSKHPFWIRFYLDGNSSDQEFVDIGQMLMSPNLKMSHGFEKENKTWDCSRTEDIEIPSSAKDSINKLIEYLWNMCQTIRDSWSNHRQMLEQTLDFLIYLKESGNIPSSVRKELNVVICSLKYFLGREE